jgi:hypothetical protein
MTHGTKRMGTMQPEAKAGRLSPHPVAILPTASWHSPGLVRFGSELAKLFPKDDDFYSRFGLFLVVFTRYNALSTGRNIRVEFELAEEGRRTLTMLVSVAAERRRECWCWQHPQAIDRVTSARSIRTP